MNCLVHTVSLLTLSLGVLAGCSPAQAPEAADPALAARRAALHAAGLRAHLLLHPVRVLGRADADVADALGLVLERRGMAALGVATPPFDPGDADWAEVPDLLRVHVRGAARPTGGGETGSGGTGADGEPGDGRDGWHLYAQFLGDPRRGPTEVRFAIVDAAGDPVWIDRQLPGDPAFRRTAGRDPDPLGCATLVADRLFELADWRPARGGVEDGAFQRRWRAKSGLPDDAERAAIAQRLVALRRDLATATFAVWPSLRSVPPAPDAQPPASAPALAARLMDELGCAAATAVDRPPLVVAATSNEQRRLWDLAAALQQALRAQPIAADFAVAVDLALDTSGRGMVHVVVATRAGDVVLADLQNDQHRDFRRLAPKTAADGEALAVARLRELLR
ncbi:MAG: hypothetical protein AB7O97_13755 [Planctomycetota bacterium]